MARLPTVGRQRHNRQKAPSSALARGAGNNGARKHVRPFSLLNIARREQGISVAITDRMAAWRRERRVLARVSRAAWRLEQAERERSWALASARVEGVSIRTMAAAAGLSPARVHQITADADLDGLDAALGELRAAGRGLARTGRPRRG
jgi:hypothetical protein